MFCDTLLIHVLNSHDCPLVWWHGTPSWADFCSHLLFLAVCCKSKCKAELDSNQVPWGRLNNVKCSRHTPSTIMLLPPRQQFDRDIQIRVQCSLWLQWQQAAELPSWEACVVCAPSRPVTSTNARNVHLYHPCCQHGVCCPHVCQC